MSACPPRSANAAEKMDDPTNSQHTIAVVFAVRNTDSLSTLHLNCRYAPVRSIAPAAPSAAASVGVAQPKMIDPSTARMSAVSGKNEVSSIFRISSRSKVKMV